MRKFDRIKLCETPKEMAELIIRHNYCFEHCENRTCEDCAEEMLLEDYYIKQDDEYRLYLNLKIRQIGWGRSGGLAVDEALGPCLSAIFRPVR